MKSSSIDLRSRGFIVIDDINKFQQYSDKFLINLMFSENPVERSVAVNLLSNRYKTENLDFVKILLERLYVENCLYTKIEICNALQKGKIKTAELMINYLGCIGNNQHKSLPKKVSKKKSYPLPRDIIARTLGKMDVKILPILFDVLNTNNQNKISEVIDAIGFLLFYNQTYANEDFLEAIIDVLKKYKSNKLIVFKCVCCLSSFNSNRSIEVLHYILNNTNNSIIKAQAIRSLNILKHKIQINN